MSDLRSPAPGFTLLEILVAVLISAVIVMVAVTSSRQLSRLQEYALADQDRTRTARILLDRIERELLGTMLVVRDPEETGDTRNAHPWLFFADDRVFDSNDSDALRFVTRSPGRAPGEPGAGAVRVVTYAVETAQDEDRLDLYRSERGLPRSLEKAVDVQDGLPMVEDVYRFSLRYRNETGTWVESWDSTDVASLDQLPQAVEVTVQLVEQQPDGTYVAGREHIRVVQIPIRPIEPRALADAAAGCAGGMTVARCVNQFSEGLRQRGDVRSELAPILGRVGGSCWADVVDTDDGVELRLLLEEVGNPDDLCAQ